MIIKGKNVLITGSAVRLGKLIATNLAKEGANILIHYNNSYKEAKTTIKLLSSYNIKTDLIKADLRNINEIKLLISKAIEFFGKLHIVINSASIFYKTPINKVNISQWNDIINTNLRGSFFCCKYAGMHMYKINEGKIINISDIGGIIPWKNYSIYCISKAGMITMTKALAKEFAPYVQINAIAPGIILLKHKINAEEKEKLASKNLLQTIGSPLDIVNCIKFILQSDFITGSVFTIDGGQLIKTY